MSFGLAFAIFFISLGHGTYAQLINDAVRLQAGHVTLEHMQYRDAPAVDLFVEDAETLRQEAQKHPHVAQTKLLVLAQGVAKSGNGAAGVAIVGIEPGVERTISPLPKNIIDGKFLEPDDDASVVIGVKLAEHLKVGVGKKVVLASNDVTGALVEELCRVKGIFKTGSDETDAYFVQIPLRFARRLYHMPPRAATQVGILAKHPGDKNRLLKDLRATLPLHKTVALPWEEVIPEVAAWIRLDRTSNYIFQCVLLCTVLFTIFNTLLMSVLERQKEFAVQLALGTPQRRLQAQIFAESAIIGALGSLGGMVLGGLIGLYGQIYGIDLTHFYKQGVSISNFALSTVMRSQVTWGLLATVGSIVFVATCLLCFIPMQRTRSIRVIEQLRD